MVCNKVLVIQEWNDLNQVVGYGVLSYFSYFIYIWAVDDFVELSEHHFTFDICFTSPTFYLTCLITVSACLVLDIIQMSIGRFIYKDTRDVVRNQALSKKGTDDPKFLEEWNTKCEEQRLLG